MNFMKIKHIKLNQPYLIKVKFVVQARLKK